MLNWGFLNNIMTLALPTQPTLASQLLRQGEQKYNMNAFINNIEYCFSIFFSLKYDFPICVQV